ncbi:MAG: HAMP domain-containing sensor histidine kinase [Polyangiaceae bacterium]
MVSDDDKRSAPRIAELEAALAEARAACAAKDRLLSMVSHELRSPMSALLGFSQLLLRDAKSDPHLHRHQRRLETIQEVGDHIVHLLDDLGSLARSEATAASIDLQCLDLGHAMREVAGIFQETAEEAGVHLESVPLPNGTPNVRADRMRLRQILLNLVSNAVKYNRPGGSVTLDVSRLETARIRVIVMDTGTGIPFEKQSGLFGAFHRAGRENGPIPGTGLGLLLARRMAEQMGGTVAFRSVPGEGSAFWVELDALDPVSFARENEDAPLPDSPSGCYCLHPQDECPLGRRSPDAA